MSTQISEIGKNAAIEKLFEGSGFENKEPISISEKGECCHVGKLMLEGVDFDLTYTPIKHLGYKSVLNVIGEIYAEFHLPVSLIVTLGISNRFSFEDVSEFWQGVLAAVKDHSIKHISLDMNPSSSGLCISLSACGVQRKGTLEKRPASKAFDLICLSGNVGAAYMGMHVLEREKVAFNSDSKQPDLSKYKYLLESYLSPYIDPDILKRFSDADIFPVRGYFITKGLAEGVKRLAKETGMGTKIYMEKIPIASQTFAMAEEINMDPITAGLNGGDDYKFIFTVSIEKHETFKREFQDYDVIGHLAKPEVGSVLVTPEGAELELKALGS